MKTFEEFVEILQELEESSTGENLGRRQRERLTGGRAFRKMKPDERTTASIATRAGVRGTGRLSTKDLREKPKEYTTYNPASEWGDRGSTKVSTYITSFPSTRAAMKGADIGIVKKTEPKDPERKWGPQRHLSSKDSVIRARDFRKAIIRSGGDKRGKVHDVSLMQDDISREKNDQKGRQAIGRNLIQGVKDIPKHLEKVGVKKGDIVTGKPSAVVSGEDSKIGARKRGEIYSKLLGSRATKRSPKTGLMIGTVKEFLELEESSGDERSGRRTRGKVTLARGRGADMTPRERTVASITSKAGLKGTGKYSTKDLRTKPSQYTTYDGDIDDDSGSTEQDHWIQSHASPRRFADTKLVRKLRRKREGRFITNRPEVVSSSKSVSAVKDFKKSLVKAGANQRSKVHEVDIMPRDPNVAKGDPTNLTSRGKNFIQAIKDTPKELKKAGAKKRDPVVGKPTAVMDNEDERIGVAKRAKLYKKIFGKKSSKKSPRHGFMIGSAD